MLRIGGSRWLLVCSALFAGGLVAVGCSGSDSDNGSGTGGTSTGSGGDAAGVGGDAAGLGGATGTGGAAETVQKDCAVKTPVSAGLIVNFDDYDGMSEPDQYTTVFNAAADQPGAVWTGPWFSPDESGTPFSGMVAGNNSNYGMGISNPAASDWGGAMGLWMNCVDATATQGISFFVRGDTPPGTGGVALAMEDTSPPAEDDPAGGGTCIAALDGDCEGPSVDFTVTNTWTQVQFAWSDFTPGVGSSGASVPASGNNITGISFSAYMEWMEDPANPGVWIAVEAAYELVVDDVAFF
jgi:hypothetical protein